MSTNDLKDTLTLVRVLIYSRRAENNSKRGHGDSGLENVFTIKESERTAPAPLA